MPQTTSPKCLLIPSITDNMSEQKKKKIDKSFFVNNPPRARSHPLRPFPQQKLPYQNIDTRHKPPPVYQPKIDCDRSNGFNNHITVEKKRKLGPQNDVKVDQLHVCQQKIDCDRSKGSNIDITVAKKRKFGPKNDLKIDQPLSKTDGLSDFVFSSDTVSAFGLIVERFLSFSSLFLIKVSFSQETYFMDRVFRVYEDSIRERIEKSVRYEYGSTVCNVTVEDHVDLAWACWESDVESMRREADMYGACWFLKKSGKEWKTAMERVMGEFGMVIGEKGYGWKSERKEGRWGGDLESCKGMIHATLGWFEEGGSVSGSVNFCRRDGESWPMTVNWMIFCGGEGKEGKENVTLRIESGVYLRFTKIQMRVISDRMEVMPITTDIFLKFNLEETRQDGVFVWTGSCNDVIDFKDNTQKSICVYYKY